MLGSLVLPWSHVLYGSIVGPGLAAAVLWLVHEREVRTSGVVVAGGCAGTWLWNAMLNVRHAGVIDVDLPFRPFPISWQDAGTAVFAFAAISAGLLATVHRDERGSRSLKVAGIATAVILAVDIYTW